MDHGADDYRRFLDGDDAGIVAIIRDYKDGLMLFLNRYVNNIHAAEDLTEDTFFKLVTKKPRFTPNHSFKTWLYTIGRNLALNHIRQNGRLADTPAEELTGLRGEAASLERSYLREEQKLQLNRALSRVRAEYAAVLHLKYFEDMDNGQLARVLKKNKRQIENMLYQAKLALKTELEQEGFTYEDLS